jgi:hypothetical protein
VARCKIEKAYQRREKQGKIIRNKNRKMKKGDRENG